FGVIVAILTVFFESGMRSVDVGSSIIDKIHRGAYDIVGVAFFAAMAFILFRVAISKQKRIPK
ncbi:MAG: hypothetical protein ACJ75F_04195, partial [Flavisolibacter sp.]